MNICSLWEHEPKGILNNKITIKILISIFMMQHIWLFLDHLCVLSIGFYFLPYKKRSTWFSEKFSMKFSLEK